MSGFWERLRREYGYDEYINLIMRCEYDTSDCDGSVIARPGYQEVFINGLRHFDITLLLHLVETRTLDAMRDAMRFIGRTARLTVREIPGTLLDIIRGGTGI